MLTIRNGQVEAMAANALLEFRHEVVGLVRRKYPELQAQARSYVEDLAKVGLETCRDHGFDRQGTMIEFVEALVKNDQHPLSPEALSSKAATVMTDLRSRARFLRLRALAASAAPSAPDADPDPTEE